MITPGQDQYRADGQKKEMAAVTSSYGDVIYFFKVIFTHSQFRLFYNAINTQFRAFLLKCYTIASRRFIFLRFVRGGFSKTPYVFLIYVYSFIQATSIPYTGLDGTSVLN